MTVVPQIRESIKNQYYKLFEYNQAYLIETIAIAEMYDV